MAFEIDRRKALQAMALGAGSYPFLGGLPLAWAAGDTATIGWPSDVPSWDPNQRFTPDAQPIFKLVFDQPLDQDPKLTLIPNLLTKWELAPDGLSMPVELRDDVTFHNGDKMTADDFRYTFFERIKAGHKVDTANSWRKVSDIEVQSPTRAVIKFSSPGADSAAMADLPGQLHRAEEIHGIGRRRRLQPEADRHRAVQARRIPAQFAHRSRAQRCLLGAEAEDPAGHLRDHQGPVGARRRRAVRPGRSHRQRAGSRGRPPRQGSFAGGRDQSDHPRDPAAVSQRSRFCRR